MFREAQLQRRKEILICKIEQPQNVMGRHSTLLLSSIVLTPPPSPTKKRKRDEPTPTSELEVDVLAPEPPSKKALRKAKKEKVVLVPETEPGNGDITDAVAADQDISSPQKPNKTLERSELGVWIGNLPWTATKTDLRNFFTQNNESLEGSITRLHMPPPSRATLAASQQRIKPQNRGFAYVDFSTQEAFDAALNLSEKLLSGRRVLIKDAKSFDGRPNPIERNGIENSMRAGKQPSTRIFVGNLGFDVTKDDLVEHFEQCGEVADVQIATFEDSGKCKGYGWIQFVGLEASESAIRGWINFGNQKIVGKGDHEDADVDGHLKKTPKPTRWWINKLQGRPLRTEFAEDKVLRYRKRFGRANIAEKDHTDPARFSSDGDTASKMPTRLMNGGVSTSLGQERPSNIKRIKKVDAKQIKPGAALALAPRSVGAIFEGKGRKIVFD